MMNYVFQEKQELKFYVIDIDDPKSTRITDHDYVGEITTTLGEVVGSKGSSITKALVNDKNPKRKNGHICVRVEQVVDTAEEHWTFKFSCSKLEKKDFFGSSDPFLVISKMTQDNQFTPVYTSEVYKVNLNPNFQQFTVQLSKLCNGQKDRPIRFEVYDWNRSGTHELIGFVETKVLDLKPNQSTSYDIKDPKKANKSGYKSSGTLILEKCSFVRDYTFLEYLQGGCEVNLVVAIDFTGSNGDPKKTDSLHYRSPQRLNDYQKAIMSVGDILTYYDYDKKYPVYGFGGFINQLKVTSHCFACTFNESAPEVIGVQGILDAYNYALDNIQLSGPTNFAQIIQKAASFAQDGADHHYYVLLIMTDGEITDMEKTIPEIIKASGLPLSIIIVGVGNEKFENMNVLDGDDRALQYQGKKSVRDIVQFVPFRKYSNAPIDALAEEVLKEVPDQLRKYMYMNKYVPKQRVYVDPYSGIPQQQQQQQQYEPINTNTPGSYVVDTSYDKNVVAHIVVDPWQMNQGTNQTQ